MYGQNNNASVKDDPTQKRAAANCEDSVTAKLNEVFYKLRVLHNQSHDLRNNLLDKDKTIRALESRIRHQDVYIADTKAYTVKLNDKIHILTRKMQNTEREAQQRAIALDIMISQIANENTCKFAKTTHVES